MFLAVVIAALVGYLLGALPFGWLVARAHGVDIFKAGSGNPGATNVRRVLGGGPGNLVLFLDALKGALATFAPYGYRLIARSDASPPFSSAEYGYLAITGLFSAILGHSFSCFTKFRGGKGVATGAGGFLVLFPPGVLIAIAVWGVTLLLTGYVSLASMLAALALPAAAYFLHGSSGLIGISVAVAVFVVIRHRSNVARLAKGTEPRLKGKVNKPENR